MPKQVNKAEPKKILDEKITILVNGEVKDMIQHAAYGERRSMNNWLNTVILEALHVREYL